MGTISWIGILHTQKLVPQNEKQVSPSQNVKGTICFPSTEFVRQAIWPTIYICEDKFLWVLWVPNATLCWQNFVGYFILITEKWAVPMMNTIELGPEISVNAKRHFWSEPTNDCVKGTFNSATQFLWVLDNTD